jgi:peptide-methionine (S)-S-oxide reductase
MTSPAKAILAGGCFWNLQDRIRNQPGVVSTRVGYTGGDIPNATYDHHEGHAESVEVVYDVGRVDFRTVLQYFFSVHDPTTKDRQGKDIGRSYRSAIFYLDDEQKRIALTTMADIDDSSQWHDKIVTEVSPAQQFWEAEPEHQDYLQK